MTFEIYLKFQQPMTKEQQNIAVVAAEPALLAQFAEDLGVDKSSIRLEYKWVDGESLIQLQIADGNVLLVTGVVQTYDSFLILIQIEKYLAMITTNHCV